VKLSLSAAHESQIRNTLESNSNLNIQRRADEAPPAPVRVSIIYNVVNRNQNMGRIQRFARTASAISDAVTGAQTRNVRASHSRDGSFDLRVLSEALENSPSNSSSAMVNVQHVYQRRRDHNEEETARDFEVGFLGEQFVSVTFYLAIKY